MTDVVVVYRGWNNSASSWGSGVWSGDSAVEGASGNTGSVSITASANISVTGVVGTGQVGTTTVSATANVSPSGVSSTGQVGSATVSG
jgi:hypothetical protein